MTITTRIMRRTRTRNGTNNKANNDDQGISSLGLDRDLFTNQTHVLPYVRFDIIKLE